MKKHLLWSVAAIFALGLMLWGIAQVLPPRVELATLFPDNALLYIQAKDFKTLLNDWNTSEEKRTWLKGDDYAEFSRSHLFERLSQAQAEFSAAASIATDDALLASVAGSQSALAVYDIGSLHFVYVTRMPQAKIEATPLWQVREKFEQRTEGSAHFFVHFDSQSNRTAAFAALDGWLILATREDLVAGVLDRLQGAHPHSLPDEPWYADSVKQARSAPGDLRMVLNLEKIVPSPQFRTYWVQRNVTEMKQYRAAICDLDRAAETYREQRVLLRRSGIHSTATGDVSPLLELAPPEAVFRSAQASPGVDRTLSLLRENILELKPSQQQPSWSMAPPAANAGDAGSAAMFEERIDIAPVIAARTDPYQPLRTLLADAQPSTLLQLYTTRSATDDMFVAIDRAVVVDSLSHWNQAAIQSAISAALRPGLTASQIGITWTTHTGVAGGAYASLDGPVSLHMAVRENRLMLSNSESVLTALLSRPIPGDAQKSSGITYAAVFAHTPRESQMFRKLFGRIDTASHSNAPGSANAEGAPSAGQSPAFFSGNIASLSRTFSRVDRETVEEKDEGERVTQSVTYNWRHP